MTGNGAQLRSPIPFPSSIKALIFDLDGTLIDSAVGIAACLDRIAQERGAAPVTVETVCRLISKGALELVGQSLGSADPEADLTLFRKILAARITDPAELYPGVAKAIRHFAKAGVTMGICSNKPQHLTLRTLEDVGLTDCFGAIVGGDAASGHKPDPAHLDEVCRLLGLSRDGCLLIGDSEVDQAAARAAGMPFLFADYGYALEGCSDYCRRYGDFPALAADLMTELGL